MLCKCYWIVLYIVHFTAFCLGGGAVFSRHGVYVPNTAVLCQKRLTVIVLWPACQVAHHSKSKPTNRGGSYGGIGLRGFGCHYVVLVLGTISTVSSVQNAGDDTASARTVDFDSVRLQYIAERSRTMLTLVCQK